MSQEAHHETELEQQRELERIYHIIIAMNEDGTRTIGAGSNASYSMKPLQNNDLALIKRAFGITTERTVV